MPRLLVASAVLLWVGATLLLSRVRWFSRQPLTARLRPYEPGGLRAGGATGLLSVSSFREVIGPIARQSGERLAGLLGVDEPIALRLQRVHSPLDATAFRVRQLGWAAGALAAGATLAAATRPPLAIALLFVGGGGLLGFLLIEQQLSGASDRWKRHVFLELPVLSEQLAMLLGAGYSLGGALSRLASRGAGACGRDLAVVCGRMRQGLTEVEALREWAAITDVDALSRLVAVLALNREAGDLGRLVGEEARSIRREVQRELIEQIERRGQQVWIPVTVATLVPGAVLLAVPFIEALRLFSTT
ncbi:MAG: type II secretion system F family protein [Acidimicrobiales bacterium]